MGILFIYIKSFHGDHFQTISWVPSSFSSDHFMGTIFINNRLHHRDFTSNIFMGIIIIYIKSFHVDHFHLHQIISWGSFSFTSDHFMGIIFFYIKSFHRGSSLFTSNHFMWTFIYIKPFQGIIFIYIKPFQGIIFIYIIQFHHLHQTISKDHHHLRWDHLCLHQTISMRSSSFTSYHFMGIHLNLYQSIS